MVVTLLLSWIFLTSALSANTFLGELKTGLFQLEGQKQTVYVYVPEGYEAKNLHPLVVLVPGDGEEPEPHAQEWVKFAKRKSCILLVPSFKRRDSDVPYAADKWMLGLVKSVSERYKVHAKKIYLVGKEEGAHYAAYLGANHPEAFSAVALLNGSWVGPFEKLIQAEQDPSKQIPFFVALKEGPKNQGLIQKTVQKAYEFEKKGYPVYLEKFSSKEEFSTLDFKKRVFEWLESKAQSWAQTSKSKPRSSRKKLQNWLERNTRVD